MNVVKLSPGQTIEQSWIPHATLLDVNVEVKLFEDGNDGFKRGKPKMAKRTCREGYVHCKIHPRVGDDESELGSICRNCKRY